MTDIRGFHAHVYFDTDTRDGGAGLRRARSQLRRRSALYTVSPWAPTRSPCSRSPSRRSSLRRSCRG